MFETTVLLATTVVLGAFLVEFAIRREVAPFVVFWRGWTVTAGRLWTDPAAFLQVFSLFAVGWIIQEYFVRHPLSSVVGLTAASVLWQAAMSVLLALCAARFHLSIVGGLFADAGMGSITLPQFRKIAAKVALVGGALWLFIYVFTVVSNLIVWHSPAQLISASAISAAVLCQLLLAPFALIRPAIACGAKQPVANALRLAMQHIPLLLAVVVLMAASAFAIEFGLGLFQALWGSNVLAQVIAAACIVIFSVFQFFAYEAATLIVLRDAVRATTGEQCGVV
ncbi:MAG TPA: hypothetical protein VIJ67_06010 [Pseudolabrys sp.]